MISFQNVTFRYGSRVILKDVSFTAQPGTCTVLAGPNGIGKSTALALAAGALRPRSGKIIREGKLGYSPQEAAVLPDLNVKDNLRFFAGLCRAPLPENPFLPLVLLGSLALLPIYYDLAGLYPQLAPLQRLLVPCWLPGLTVRPVLGAAVGTVATAVLIALYPKRRQV